jgi:hypothetical protein
MRRFVRVIRKPALWLAPFLFLTWGGLFRAWLAVPPRFVIRTGAAHHEDYATLRPAGTWSSLRGVSGDGGKVTVAVYQGDFRWPDRRLQVWETRTGAERTPALWGNAEWQRLLSAPGWRHADSGQVLVTHPSRVRGNAACEGYVLGFWDVATGEPLGEWALEAPEDGGGMITGLMASDGGRYLAAEYDADYGRDPSVRPRSLLGWPEFCPSTRAPNGDTFWCGTSSSGESSPG